LILDLRSSSTPVSSSSSSASGLDSVSLSRKSTGLSVSQSSSTSMSQSTVLAFDAARSTSSFSQIHSHGPASTLRTGRALKPAASAAYGSTNASSRWIQGVLVKDAACQTKDPFVPENYNSVDWSFMQCASHNGNYSHSDSGSDASSDRDEDIADEIRQLGLHANSKGLSHGAFAPPNHEFDDRVATTLLQKSLSTVSSGRLPSSNSWLSGDEREYPRASGPDADLLLANRIHSNDSVFGASRGSSKHYHPEPTETYKYAHLDQEYSDLGNGSADGKSRAMVAWMEQVAANTRLVRPIPQRPSTSGYMDGKPGLTTPRMSLVHDEVTLKEHAETVMAKAKSNNAPVRRAGSTSSASESSSASFYQYHRSVTLKTQHRASPSHVGAAPHTPASSIHHSKSARHGTSRSSIAGSSEDENSSVASSFQTMPSSLGSPENAVAFKVSDPSSDRFGNGKLFGSMDGSVKYNLGRSGGFASVSSVTAGSGLVAGKAFRSGAFVAGRGFGAGSRMG
ncbi:hypothetical protein HDU81_003449, partial [Chytriomyces hyalinus]